MPNHPTLPLRRLAALCVLATAAVAAPSAQAACASHATTAAFGAWGDPAAYFLAPDGGFEAGASGWALSGGAKVVEGNEPFFLQAKSDHRALSLTAPGASATSPFVCVGAAEATIRVVQRAVATAALNGSYVSVYAIARDPKTKAQSAPVQVAWLGLQGGDRV